MFRAVDLNQFAEAIAPPAWLVRASEPVASIDPQSFRDHPAAQRLVRDRTTVQFRQFLGRKGWTKIRIPLAHDRQCQGANLSRKAVIARLAAPLRRQACSTILFEAAQKTEHLPPMQAHQRTGIDNTQPP